MITGYHIYRGVWSRYIGELLYCRHDGKSAEGTSISAGNVEKQNQNIYSLEVATCKETQANQTTATVT